VNAVDKRRGGFILASHFKQRGRQVPIAPCGRDGVEVFEHRRTVFVVVGVVALEENQMPGVAERVVCGVACLKVAKQLPRGRGAVLALICRCEVVDPSRRERAAIVRRVTKTGDKGHILQEQEATGGVV
jgi:hypothetical protein